MKEAEQLLVSGGLSLERMKSFLAVVEAGSIARAAEGDPTRQSQFSRQIKELEGFFGVALTKREGRRIAITPAGEELAGLIRLQFGELLRFRQRQAGQSAVLTIGCSGSVAQWWVLPHLAQLRRCLGDARLNVIQCQSKEVARGVTDGRLDLGIVRGDVVPRLPFALSLGPVGYSVFYPKKLGAKLKQRDAHSVLRALPLVTVPIGGRFERAFSEWLEQEELEPQVIARMSSFVACSEAVNQGLAASVLPDLAAKVLPSSAVAREPMPWKYRRELVLTANRRSLDRVGIGQAELQACQRELGG